jgi:hypothetical protein
MKKRQQFLPFMVALIVGLAMMPTNVYKVCAWNVGTLEIEPWRRRTAGAISRAVTGLLAWFERLWNPRTALACAGLVLLLLAMHVGAGQDGVLLAIAPVGLSELKTKRANLLREAEALKQADGTFAGDETRSAFDAKMAEVETVDGEIRTAEAAESQRQAAEAERARGLAIRQAARAAKLPETFADDLIARGVTVDAAREAVLAELARRGGAEHPTTQVLTTEDQTDKAQRGITAWLLQRASTMGLVRQAAEKRPDLAGLQGVPTDPGEFRGMSLLDLAKEMLERAGTKTRGIGKMEVARLAFRAGANSQSDFAVALANVMHKTLLAAYATAPDTWRKWCGIGSVSDFRVHNRYQMGWLTQLDAVLESGEILRKGIPDAVREQIQAGTRANILALTRQAIVNDDMGLFSRVSVQVGRAVGLSIELDAYATLALNANMGPLMTDGVALFAAGHNNVSGGNALSAAAIDIDRQTMAAQTDPSGVEILDLRPSVLLLPISLGSLARQINEAQYDPDTVAGKQMFNPNTVRGLFKEVVDTPRLAGTRRYLFADPSVNPAIEVAFLDGVQEPYLETRDGWEVDGAEWKVRIDYGVGGVDFRTAVTDAGV